MAYCRGCGQEIDDRATFCPNCGRSQREPEKDEGLTVILSVVCGMFGIMGIGHMYIGRFARGIGFLLLGFTPVLLILLTLMPIMTSWDEVGPWAIMTASLISIMLWIVILVVQAFDAYRLVQERNMRGV